jgi:hypothetical protein
MKCGKPAALSSLSVLHVEPPTHLGSHIGIRASDHVMVIITARIGQRATSTREQWSWAGSLSHPRHKLAVTLGGRVCVFMHRMCSQGENARSHAPQ